MSHIQDGTSKPSYVQSCTLTLQDRVYQQAVGKNCQALNICGIKFSQFPENDILAHSNFGAHYIPWFQILKKTSFCSYARPVQPGPNRTRLCGPCIAAIAGD